MNVFGVLRLPISQENCSTHHQGFAVPSGKGSNSKQIGSMEPDVLAKQLLVALAQAGKT